MTEQKKCLCKGEIKPKEGYKIFHKEDGCGNVAIPPHDNKTEESWEAKMKSIMKSTGYTWRGIKGEEVMDRKFEIYESSLKQFISQIRQEAVQEELENISYLKKIHEIELDAIACKSLEDFMIWAEDRKSIIRDKKK